MWSVFWGILLKTYKRFRSTSSLAFQMLVSCFSPFWLYNQWFHTRQYFFFQYFFHCWADWALRELSVCSYSTYSRLVSVFATRPTPDLSYISNFSLLYSLMTLNTFLDSLQLWEPSLWVKGLKNKLLARCVKRCIGRQDLLDKRYPHYMFNWRERLDWPHILLLWITPVRIPVIARLPILICFSVLKYSLTASCVIQGETEGWT